MKKLNNIVPMQLQIGVAALLTGLAFSEAVLYEDKINFVLFLLFGALGLPFFIGGASKWFNTVSAWGLCLWCWSGLMRVFGILLGTVLAVVDVLLLWNFRRAGVHIPLFAWGSMGGASGASYSSNSGTSRASRAPRWNGDVLTMHARFRLPLGLIPVPWLTYSLDRKRKVIRRNHALKMDDPERISRIENYYLSGTIYRGFFRSTVFGFRSTKPHSDNYIVWRGIPWEMVGPLEDMLLDQPQPKKP